MNRTTTVLLAVIAVALIAILAVLYFDRRDRQSKEAVDDALKAVEGAFEDTPAEKDLMRKYGVGE